MSTEHDGGAGPRRSAAARAKRRPGIDYDGVTAMGADQHGLDEVWDPLAPHLDGLYLSFDTDLRPERLRDAFPPPVLARLRRLKARYDPGNLFRDNFDIRPDPGGTAEAGERAGRTAVKEAA